MGVVTEVYGWEGGVGNRKVGLVIRRSGQLGLLVVDLGRVEIWM